MNLARPSRRRALQYGLATCASATGLLAWSAPPPSTAHILVVGDSLSAEYGLSRGTGWVALLQERLRQQSLPAHVSNASISGDTTSGGRARLPALLRQHQPTHVVIALGGNDALRGLPLDATRGNLQAMVQAAQQSGAQVLLVGMQVPSNYGSRYTQAFAQLFADVASAEQTALLPFLLQGFAEKDDALTYFQSDRIHPNAQAQPLMLENVWQVLAPLLPHPATNP